MKLEEKFEKLSKKYSENLEINLITFKCLLKFLKNLSYF